ncbi:hypothetical protein E2C01_064131 [Portunus trituberculatus]|uniref:Uncharacterized protein n=1 Tax=Portunus trituberculatus TaxID=210409 RepID=A0A5B7HMG0_PORTR|nr:hypothetical protein [Portunus trituberculatus]
MEEKEEKEAIEAKFDKGRSENMKETKREGETKPGKCQITCEGKSSSTTTESHSATQDRHGDK